MWIYFYLLIFCSIQNSMNQCETEYSYNIENNVTTTIIWESEINDTTVSSLCLHENNTLVKRNCTQSIWYPTITPQCQRLQKIFVPKCVGEDQANTDFCIYYKPPYRWSYDYGVTKVENINDTLRIAHSVLNITEMWLPVRRIEPFGRFTWRYPEEKYKPYEHPLLKNNKQNNTYNYDCIAATNITVIEKRENEFDIKYIPKIVDCGSNFPIVYVYKKINRYFVSNNITEKYGSPLFYSTKGNKAFYIHEKCQKIAEPRYKEDNILIKQLIQNKTCIIGIKYATNVSNFVWESTNEPINYTDWILSTRFHFNKVVITSNGWSLNDSESIQCYVCEIVQQIYDTTLNLEKNEDHTLTLTAYSYDQKYYSIFCRTRGLEDIVFNYKLKYMKEENKESENNNKIDTSHSRTVWKLEINQNYPIEFNYIICTASLYPTGEMVSSNEILYGQTSPPEFSFEVTFIEHCMHHICDPYLNKDFTKSLPKIVDNEYIIKKIRAIHILNINEINGNITLLYHARIANKINILHGYAELRRILKRTSSKVIVDLTSVKSCDACLPNRMNVDNFSIYWSFAQIGETVSNKDCILSNNLPITRHCIGDFLSGGIWTEVDGNCSNRMPTITKQLQDLRSEMKTMTVTNVTNKLASLTQQSSSLLPMDIIFISQVFKDITSNLTESDNTIMIAEDVSITISNLVATNYTSMKLLSGEDSNATNDILGSIEGFMENITKHNLDERGIFQQVEPNFMYQLFDPFVQNITGIALIRPNTTNKNPPFTDYTTELLTADSYIEKLIEIENLEAAAFIPRMLLDEIKMVSANESAKINMMFYYNDSLFIEKNTRNTKVLTKVFSISISGYNNKNFSSSLPIIFKNFYTDKTNKFKCGYWDFGVIGQYSSRWYSDNTSLSKYLDQKHIQVCTFHHLTNFALLLGISFKQNNPESITAELADNILIYITSIGSILSILGIFFIFTTAAVFKFWRKMTGTKVILNVSICILLQIVLLYGNLKTNTISCIITGSLIHYSILSGFMWSLIMAYLHYKRFVKVLGNTTSHLILKSFFVGWVGPMIPVAIVLIINSSEYLPEQMYNYSDFICYPDGIVLYTTVYLPVGIIVLINFIIFCIIIYNVHSQTRAMSTFRYNYDEKEMMIKEARLGVFLFFSLSLTWIFGLLAASQYCDICTFIFVATASCQGFMLFVYYVLFNKDIRLSWITFIKTSRIVSSSSILTTSKSNLTNDENKINKLKTETIGMSNKNLHQLDHAEEEIKKTCKNFSKDNKLKKIMNPLKQDELRKRVKVNKDNIVERQDSPNSSYDDYVTESKKHQNIETEINKLESLKKDLRSSHILKNTEFDKNVDDGETTRKKTLNPQQELIMHELMMHQEKRNSPFRK